MNIAARDRIIKARSALVMQQPFYGALALRLVLAEREEIETAATDGASLFYAPGFVLGLTERELLGLLAHEVMHVANRHHTRRGNRDAELWNVAADYAINGDLKRAGFALPKGALLDARYSSKGAEEIYRELAREREQREREREQQGKQGNAAPAPCPDPGKCGGVMDAPGGAADIAKADAEAQIAVRQAISVARAAGHGTLPGGLETLINALNAPKQDWRAILREFINSRARVDYSWQRPNRRLLGAGYVLPGTIADGIARLVVAIDTSGSISQRALAAFAEELRGIWAEGGIQRMTIVYADAGVQRVDEFEQGEDIALNVPSGGGTDFAPVMAWAAENAEDAAALVYFTDMQCGSWGEEPGCPVLWAAYGREEWQGKAPFGETVQIDADA